MGVISKVYRREGELTGRKGESGTRKTGVPESGGLAEGRVLTGLGAGSVAVGGMWVFCVSSHCSYTLWTERANALSWGKGTRKRLEGKLTNV